MNLWRAIRVAVATGIGVAVSTLCHNPTLIWITPILAGIAKAARLKHPTWTWLPL